MERLRGGGERALQGFLCAVHYQVATSADMHVHRNGRTARPEEEGLAIAPGRPQGRVSRFRVLVKVQAVHVTAVPLPSFAHLLL